MTAHGVEELRGTVDGWIALRPDPEAVSLDVGRTLPEERMERLQTLVADVIAWGMARAGLRECPSGERRPLLARGVGPSYPARHTR